MFMTSAGGATQQVQVVNKIPGGCRGELSDTSTEWANVSDTQLGQLFTGKEELLRDV